MQFQPGKPRSSSVLACALAAAGIVLTVAGCSGHVTPLGPNAAPQPRHLGSPIVLQAVVSQPPTATGSCPAGYVTLSGPGRSPACYRKLGTPVTFTSAAVTSAAVTSISGKPAPPPSALLIAVPAADRAALTAVSTTAYHARGAMDITVAGKTWALPLAMAPLTGGQFEIALPSSKQALQLERILVPPS